MHVLINPKEYQLFQISKEETMAKNALSFFQRFLYVGENGSVCSVLAISECMTVLLFMIWGLIVREIFQVRICKDLL